MSRHEYKALPENRGFSTLSGPPPKESSGASGPGSFYRSILAGALVGLLPWLLASGPLRAQTPVPPADTVAPAEPVQAEAPPQTPEPPPEAPDEAEPSVELESREPLEPFELAETLGDDFKILPGSRSFILTPRDDEAGFSVLELEEGRVAVDGEQVGDDRLRELVGGVVAERLLELSRWEPRDLDRARAEVERLEAETREAETREREDRDVRREREREEALLESGRGRRIRNRSDNQFSVGSGLVIEEDESTRDVAVIGGPLVVLGEVDGDVVSVGGPVEIQGRVDGDVVAVGGSIEVGPNAIIEGEVTSIGGTVDDPHGRIRGGTVQVAVGPFDFLEDIPWGKGRWEPNIELDPWPAFWWGGGWGDVFGSIVLTILLALWITFLVLVGRRFVGQVAQRAEQEPWKAALVGLAVQILFFPTLFVVCVVLAISLIGIPLMLILLPVSLFLLFLFFSFGYAGIATWAGRLLQKRFDWREAGPYLAVLLGILLIQGWTLMGEMLAPVGGPIRLTAWLLILLGLLVKFAAWTTGLGAVFLQGFAPRPASVEGGDLPPLPAGAWDAANAPGDDLASDDLAADDRWLEEDLSPGYGAPDDPPPGGGADGDSTEEPGEPEENAADDETSEGADDGAPEKGAR